MKRLVFIIAVVLLLAAGSYYYYSQVYLPAQAKPAQSFNTTKVRSGDISITASGVGSVLPADKLSVGFQMSGILSELKVKVGDQVSAGQVLAKTANIDIQAQLATGQVNLISAQQAVDALYTNLKSDLADAQAKLISAEKNLADSQYYLTSYQSQRCDPAALTLYNGNLILAQASYDDALANYNNNFASLSDYDQRKIVAYTKVYNAQQALTTSQNTVAYCTSAADAWTTSDLKSNTDSAQIAYEDAKARVEMLKKGPDPDKLALAQARLEQAKIQVEATRSDLSKTVLAAPIAGTVTAVNATLGQAVGTAPIITIESLNKMMLRFYVEEKDTNLVKNGNGVVVTFKAFPETPVKSSISYIEPSLQTVDGELAVVAWAALNDKMNITLLSGMTADVEVVAGEAKGAMLVPVQSLRELAPGSYAVFVVSPTGTLQMAPVSVGLKDFANAQILSGVKVGDVISTGAVETK